MKNFKQIIIAILVAFSFACSPSPSQIKKILEDNPDVLAAAIEKNPVEVMEAINKAAQNAQKEMKKRQFQDEEKKREEEYKNPKIAEITPDRATRGPSDAPVTIVEYSDFQCPFCSRGFNTVEEVRKKYKGKIRFIYKHLPLDFHPLAMPAARYFEAIALQDKEKAYKFHDEVFLNQSKLNSGKEKFLESIAKKLGINMAKMKTDMKGETVQAIIDKDIAEAGKFGFSGTPGFLVGGISLKGAYPAAEFEKIIEKILKDKK